MKSSSFTQAAIAHSKHRNAIGLVGIQVNTELKKVSVKLARQWSRNQINIIPEEISKLYKKIHWGNTYIDQQTGQHFIQDLKQINRMPMRIITTQKNLKDPDEIERVRTMDKIEMTQFMLSLRQNHQVEFPINPSRTMQELEKQIALYSEHKTEAGNVDYYAPGDELDNLTKALMINCFAVRNYLRMGEEPERRVLTKKYSTKKKNPYGSGIPEGATLTGTTVYMSGSGYGSLRR